MESSWLNGVSILVTGGAGFIGSNFVRRLDTLSGIRKIFVLDSLTYAADVRRLNSLSNRVELIEGDLNNPETYRKALSQCSYVVNFAAESHVDRSIQSGLEFVQSNTLGSFSLFEECRRIPKISLVHISTDEVYGSISEGEADEDGAIMPSSPYSASKAGSDLLALANWITHKQRIVITRCCNNFGPFQNSEKFLPKVINCGLQGLAIPIYGDGTNQREWIHVDDHTSAIIKILENFTPGEVYNIGSGQRISNLDLARIVLDVIGASHKLISYSEDRKGHDFRYAVSSRKLRASLRWSPNVDFLDGVTSTVNWYKDWLDEHKETY